MRCGPSDNRPFWALGPVKGIMSTLSECVSCLIMHMNAAWIGTSLCQLAWMCAGLRSGQSSAAEPPGSTTCTCLHMLHAQGPGWRFIACALWRTAGGLYGAMRHCKVPCTDGAWSASVILTGLSPIAIAIPKEGNMVQTSRSVVRSGIFGSAFMVTSLVFSQIR